MRVASQVTAAAAVFATLCSAMQLDLNSPASIHSAAATAASGMLSYYFGNQPGQTPGLIPPPYYWWEVGEMLGVLIDFWYYTGDTTYNDLVTAALLAQTGPQNDYMPQNQTKDEGNDDQIYWAFAVMSAAEYKFPNPPATSPQWIALAEGVMNSQIARWENSTCNGGLRWQIFSFNSGWDYKNTPANGGFMNLAARLYYYTGNQTYADWAYSTWNWMYGVGLIGDKWDVYDGVTPSANCSGVNHLQWTSSAGMVLNAAAVMYAAENNSAIWQERTEGLWNATLSVFFDDAKVMMEVECESLGNCDPDQKSFKASFSRFIASSAKFAPFLYDQVKPYLEASAMAAAAQCDGQPGGNVCGLRWTMGSTWDGTRDYGQYMAAMEVIQVNLMKNATPPVTSKTGGISQGNATYGTGGDPDPTALPTITSGDRAGAGILTALVIVFILGGAWWVLG